MLYTQDVNKFADTVRAKLNLNLTDGQLNRLAKFVKSLGGETFFENFIKGVNTGVNVANAGANVLDSIKPGINTGSDAGTKEFFKRMIKF